MIFEKEVAKKPYSERSPERSLTFNQQFQQTINRLLNDADDETIEIALKNHNKNPYPSVVIRKHATTNHTTPPIRTATITPKTKSPKLSFKLTEQPTPQTDTPIHDSDFTSFEAALNRAIKLVTTNPNESTE